MDEELEPIETWPVIRSCGARDVGDECLRIQGHIGDHEGEHYSWPTAADVDPDELATFGEYLDYWTMRGGMTDDERTAYWQSWTRLTIAWALVLVGGVISLETFDGLAGDAGLFVAIYAVLVLVWQAVEAVRFRWQARRWQR